MNRLLKILYIDNLPEYFENLEGKEWVRQRVTSTTIPFIPLTRKFSAEIFKLAFTKHPGDFYGTSNTYPCRHCQVNEYPYQLEKEDSYSFWYHIKLIFRTIPAMFQKDSA